MSKDQPQTDQQKKIKKTAERRERQEAKEDQAKREELKRHSKLWIVLLILAIVVAIIVVLLATGTVTISFSGVYVVSSVTVYEDDEATVTAYEIDEHGGITAATQTVEDEVQDISYVLDEYGFYTTCTYTIEDDDGDEVEMTELRDITEADDDGRPLEIESSTYYDGELYYQELIEYTYYEDAPNIIASIDTTSSAGYETLMEYDEDGFLTYYELSWPDATTETSTLTYSYETAEDGKSITCTTIDEDGDETVYLYELDDHGNVTSVTQDSELVYEYVYTLVGDPFYVEAAIASNRKLAGPII